MRLFKISLTLQMAIATLLGIFCGLFLGDICDIFAPYSAAYIMILKITAIPYLIGAIIHGVGQLSPPQAKQILKKGVIFISLAWTINILMVYAVVYLFPHSASTQAGLSRATSPNSILPTSLSPTTFFTISPITSSPP